MASILTSVQSRQKQLGNSQAERFRLTAGFCIVLGAFLSVFGLSWDLNWHSDVGPDTFFTVPHLFIYAGIALSGITCLVTVLYSTLTYRQGKSLFPEDELTPIFWGAFRAPLSFILGGFAVVLFFFYGLFDELWHTVYGFDATILSPPHIGLVFSGLTNLALCLVVFVRAKTKPLKVLGLALAVGILLVSTVTSLESLGQIAATLPSILIAVFFTFGFMLVVSSVRPAGVVLLAALTITLFQILCWFIVPPVTQLYATSLGLFLRDYAKVNSVLATKVTSNTAPPSG